MEQIGKKIRKSMRKWLTRLRNRSSSSAHNKTALKTGSHYNLAQMLDVLQLALWRMQNRGCQVFFVEGFNKGSDKWPYSERARKRIETKARIYRMLRNPEDNEDDLRDIFREKYSQEYLDRINSTLNTVLVGNRWCLLDTDDEFHTVVGGKRVTVGQPHDFDKTIHVYGACTMAGSPWIENADTVPSQMQARLKELGHTRVLVDNCAAPGGRGGTPETFPHLIHNLALDSISFDADDIVVIYDYRKRILPAAQALGLEVFDITEHLPRNEITASNIVNSPAHLGFAFNGLLADAICDYLLANDFVQPVPMAKPDLDMSLLFDHLKEDSRGDLEEAARDYARELLDEYGDVAPDARVGAMVINANPFTLGHRHLVEYARGEVDRLYVFVVEEDLATFSFKDRLAMVRAGTADLDGVIVAPSGRLMGSTETIPEYFVKEDEPDLTIDPTKDVRIFATAVAPNLRITKRFFGEEKTDWITSQYNTAYSRILPEYGIEFVEIPRRSLEDGTPISAKRVRKLIDERDWDQLESYVPAGTITHLRKMFDRASE